VALYLVTRLAVLLFLDYRPLVMADEFTGGVVARELIKGPFLPLFFLQTADYSGGIAVTGVLTVPFFLLLGENSFALRLVHVLFSLGILMLLYAAARRFAGPRVAAVASLLYVFCPPFLVESQVTPMWHLESSLFVLGALYFFLRARYGDGGIRGTRDICLAGLLAGFGEYFMPSVAIVLILIFAVWWVLDRIFVLRSDFWLFALSFVVGFSPFLYNLYQYNSSAGQWVLTAAKLNLTSSAALAKLFNLLAVDFPASFFFRGAGCVGGALLDKVYYGVVLTAFFTAAWVYRRSLGRFLVRLLPFTRIDAGKISPVAVFLLYPVLYLAAYVGCRFGLNECGSANGAFEYRHLAPVFPFLFIALGIAFDRLADRSRVAYRAGVAALAGLCVFGILPWLKADAFGDAFRYRGYTYHLIGARFDEMYGEDHAGALGRIYKGIPDARDREECVNAYCETIAMSFLLSSPPRGTVRDYAASLESVAPPFRDDCFRGLGRVLDVGPGGLELFQEKIQGVPERHLLPLYEGLSQVTVVRSGFDRAQCLAFLSRLPPQFQGACERAMERQLLLCNPPMRWRTSRESGSP